MVVEFLTFTVAPAELDEWLVLEEQHWSRFLERQPGFVRKEMWRPERGGDQVHAVIWWNSMEEWQAIPQAALDAVVTAMGPHERTATCAAYDVLRQS